MNVGTFIKQREQRINFLYAVHIIGGRTGYISVAKEYGVFSKNVLAPEIPITQKEKNNLYKALEWKANEIYNYESELVMALKILMNECDENLIDKDITSVDFYPESCSMTSVEYVHIVFAISGNSSKKYMRFFQLRDFSELDKEYKGKPNYLYGNSLHKAYTTINYDDKIIYTEQNSREFNELKIENIKLKSVIINNMLTGFLPSDVVGIVMGFDPLSCNSTNDFLKLKFNYSK